jgi:penicillin-binding protein-related factor A (putative recombinase)
MKNKTLIFSLSFFLLQLPKRNTFLMQLSKHQLKWMNKTLLDSAVNFALNNENKWREIYELPT